MSERFPRAMVEVVYAFDAYHSLPESKHPGAGEKHKHSYWITIGYHHERNGPFTWDRVELDTRYKPLIEQLQDSDLNILCGESASDEVVASWMLSRLPGWVDFVKVDRLTPDEGCIKATTTVKRGDLLPKTKQK